MSWKAMPAVTNTQSSATTVRTMTKVIFGFFTAGRTVPRPQSSWGSRSLGLRKYWSGEYASRLETREV